VIVLPDSSAWVDYLRRGAAGQAASLSQLLEQREVVTCGPVVAELLVGARAGRRQELATLWDAVSWVDLGRPEWRRIGHVAGLLRDQGTTVALTDLEIAVAAETAGAALWTFDSDFQRLTAVMPGLHFYDA